MGLIDFLSKPLEPEEDVEFLDNLETYQKYLLADAQTSGGLLISISEEKFDSLNSKLSDSKYESTKIGSFEPLTSNQYIRVS